MTSPIRYGWACWKTYLGRPEACGFRTSAMTVLGNGVGEIGQHLERLGILEARLSSQLRLRAPVRDVLMTRSNIAGCYDMLGRKEDALVLVREIYAHSVALKLSSVEIYKSAVNLPAHSTVATNQTLTPRRRLFYASSSPGRDMRSAQKMVCI